MRFEDLYKAAQIESMKAHLLEKVPHSFDNIWSINSINKSVALRNSNHSFVHRDRLDFANRLPLHAIPRTYNELDSPNLKNNASKNSFKESLKAHFTAKLQDVIYCGRPFCKDCFPDQI